MLKNLLLTNGFHLRRAFANFAGAAALGLMPAITASAYTLVLRHGQRIEIPSEFTLTKTTLTYEISPGFNRTMQLILIDVAATERAYHETPGSFFKHTKESPVVVQPAPQATRTLTNRDLAAVRQRRIESEQHYETRRKESAPPTVEETRRRQEEEGTALRAQIREENVGKASEESYWRGRARELRTEIATVDTQINYLRGRIGEFNENSLSDLVITDVYPIWPRTTRQSRGWPYYPNAPFGYPRVARPIPGLGYPNPYGYPTGPFYDFDKSSDRADLTNRLDDVVVRRRGLPAQWRVLEDEARDARIPQIWLEP